jgi:hypothetical protein
MLTQIAGWRHTGRTAAVQASKGGGILTLHHDDRQRGGLAHLGPAWISAIAAVISALAAAGFFAGRVTAHEANPGSVASSSTPTTGGPTRAPAVHGPTPGQRLIHYTIDVAKDYGIDISNHRPQPTSTDDHDLYVLYIGAIQPGNAQLAMLDSSAPSYQACLADTRFADFIEPARRDVFCVRSHGYIAGIRVTAVDDSASGGYYTFDVTVWKAP